MPKLNLLSRLLEAAPDFLDKEMPSYSTENTFNFYSEDTVKHNFITLAIDEFDEGKVVTMISRTKKFAIIGFIGIRKEDDKPGIFKKGLVEFKEPDISFNRNIEINKGVLQVSSVEISEKYKMAGLGYLLYTNLVKAGYVILSDNLQYLGGKALWKKIAKLTKTSDYAVYVIENGKPVLDKNGDPKMYTGDNIMDKRIWASPSKTIKGSKRYTLLLLRKKVKGEKHDE